MHAIIPCFADLCSLSSSCMSSKTTLLVTTLCAASLFTYPNSTGITKVYLDENVPVTTSVLTVQTKNAGDTITSLQVSDFPQTTNLTGVLTLAGTKNLITASLLDYEKIQAYMVVLE